MYVCILYIYIYVHIICMYIYIYIYIYNRRRRQLEERRWAGLPANEIGPPDPKPEPQITSLDK